MAVESKNEFVKCLKASEILPPEKIRKLVEKFPTDDTKKFASRLVQNGSLTHWQAKVLYSGRVKLNLGNYILLDRIRSDELGDRFRATHKSLDRPVEIQLLPKSVSENVHLQNSFVGNVGLISELDHPNITHIHDVDREGVQFFLVDEAHGGKPLSQITMTPAGLILCTHQILQALAFAHSQSVIHGEVNIDNIVCVNDSQFKICGMGLSLVRRKLAGLEAATARDDLVSLAAILENSFQGFSENEKQEFDWLGKHLARLRSEPISVYPRVVVATEKMIEGWGKNVPAIVRSKNDLSTNGELSPSPEQALEQPTSPAIKSTNQVDAATITQSSAIPRSTNLSAGPADTQRVDTRSPDAPESNNRNSKQGIPLLLGLVGLGMLGALTLGILYVSGVFNSQEQTAQKQEQPSLRQRKTEVAVESSAKTKAPKPVDNANTKVQEPNDDTNSKLTPIDIAGALAKAQGKTAIEKPVNDNSLTEAERKPAVAPRINDQKALPIKPPAQTDPLAPTQDDITTEANPESVTPKAPTQSSKPSLGLIKSTVDLPTSDFKEPFLLGELAENDQLSSVSIISATTAFTNDKGALEARQVDESNWDIWLLTKPGGKGSAVARITAADNELTFHWNQEVTKKSKANGIRNCILKLATGDTTKEIILRDAVLLDIKLTQEVYNQKIKVETDWLPQIDSLKIEVEKPPQPWPTKLYIAPEVDFPATFSFEPTTKNLPIFFDRFEDQQHLSVVLQPATNRGSLVFNLGVFAKGKDTATIQYESFSSAEETVQFLQQARESRTLAKQQAEVAVTQARQAQNGQIGKRQSEAAAIRRELNLIRDNLEIAVEMRDILQDLHDATLPVTVYYELEGRRVIIAKTNND